MRKLLLGAILLSAAGTAASAVPELTVCTWNIHKGKRWERVVRELRESKLASCDLLALQEVLTGEEGRQGEKLAEAHGASLAKAGRDVILSRVPVAASGELTVNPGTGRRAVWVDVEAAPGTLVRFYSLHLSYKVERSPFITHVRRAEMEAVLAHAEAFPGPVIIAGDFNTVGWFLGGHRDAPLLESLRRAGYREASPPGRTQWSGGKVDWIFVKGLKPRGGELGLYGGSDHRWLLGVVTGE